MTEADAAQIAAWVYPAPYDFYNMEGSDEDIAELLGGAYRAVYADGRLVGFYCTGEAAQVPAGHALGVYSETDAIDIGIGMQPDRTGRGLGTDFFGFVLAEVMRIHPQCDVRLTVASFNQRAIRIYKRFDFKLETTFDRDQVTFQTMRKRRMLRHGKNQ